MSGASVAAGLTALPVSDTATVRRHAWGLVSRHRRALAGVVTAYAASAVAGLAGPWLLGRLVDDVVAGTTVAAVDQVALLLATAVLVQTGLAALARRGAGVLGERVFAELREEFLERVVALPLSTVERAGTGDLVSRTTNDIDSLSWTVRFAAPSVLVATAATALTVGAAFVTSPMVALAVLAGVPLLWPATGWYLRRAPAAYLGERAAYARINGTVTETVDGATTVDHLRLGSERDARLDDDLRRAWDVERYTTRLRTAWYPACETGYLLPVAAVLLWGGFLVSRDLATVGEVTTVALYARQLVDPLDELLSWLDELQVGAACLARVVGVGEVPPDREASGAVPVDERITADGVRYAYRPGHDVLHGVDLALRPGERLAVVGPSGAGKSTLGRLLAGIHPPSAGRVDVGGVPLVDLPLEDLRGHVALVTQEHHVFVGSLVDNLRLARPEASRGDLERALQAVDALDWARALPDGLATEIGSGAHALTPPQAQQVALARLVLADPHTLVLDEATSLLDPRAARHLERSLSAVLTGRTVVAIAHRLHTASDADRVAVVEDGRVAELGSHDELVAREGAYAALWRSWSAAPVEALAERP